MTNEDFIKLIDEEIEGYSELWELYDDLGDENERKRMMHLQMAFEMFKRKTLRKMKEAV